MRKITILFVALSVLAMSLVPAFAQDEATQTIAEIVVASATSDTPEFTTLLSAIELADPSVLEALSGEGTFTVFAPTDAAFAALFEGLGEELVATILADPELLTSILTFHVFPNFAVPSTQLAEAFNIFGQEAVITVQTLNGQFIDLTYDETAGVTINGATLVTTDIMATNGIIHVIDAVILPESRDIATIVTEFASNEETPEFTTLLSALVEAELAEMFTDPEAQYTVFAPTDAAFASLPVETLTAVLADPELLTSVLTFHVVEGLVSTATLNEVFSNVEVEGYELPAWFVSADLETATIEILTVNGETLTIASTSAVNGTVNGVNVAKFDVDASNGIIHVLDGVLVPTGE